MMNRSDLLARLTRRGDAARQSTPAALSFDFDALARDLAAGLSRRDVLRRLGRGLAATFLTALSLDRAWAQATSACARFCHDVKKEDKDARQRCLDACQACGGRTERVCQAGASDFVCCATPCCGGLCCATGATCSNGLCIRTLSDPLNCGAVGNICPANSTCVNGQCVCDGGYFACSGPFSTGPTACCNSATQSCRNGICLSGVESCPADTTPCSGTQGRSCCDAARPHCCEGLCCPANWACCDGVCQAIQHDANHCGACGNACDPQGACVNGQCVCLWDGRSYPACGTGNGCCRPGLAGHSTIYSYCQDGVCVDCPLGVASCVDRCCPPGADCNPFFTPFACVCETDGDPNTLLACGGTVVSTPFPGKPFMQINPQACCNHFGGEICQNGSCVACPAGQQSCFDRCCPPNATCANRTEPEAILGLHGGTCLCNPGYTPCADPFGSPNPAACCHFSQTCRNGICLTRAGLCPDGGTFCGGTQGQSCCDSTQPTCCDGLCCPAGQFCCGNRCSVCPCDETLCTGAQGATTCCPAGRSCCDGACVNLQSDPNNCNDCGTSCSENGICENGRCRCPDQYFRCGTGCCHQSQACLNGICSSCPDGGQACGDRCCPQAATCTPFGDGSGSCQCLDGYSPCGTVPGGTGPAACCNNIDQFCLNGICLTNADPTP